MPSPDVLAALPGLARTRELTRALAVLDCVMADDWESRYYSFDPAWAEGEQMASMRNGSGDDWFCWFGAPGAAIVGFDHESALSPYAQRLPGLVPGLLDGIPDAFRTPVLEEPAFAIEDTTFVLWRLTTDDTWHAGPVELPDGPDPDGARSLLELVLDDDPAAYVTFAADVLEVEVDPEAVAAISRSEPLTAERVAALNPDRDPQDALREAAEMTYPTA